MNTQSLIHRYLLGETTHAETEELNRLLSEDADVRQEFLLAATMDAGLRDLAIQRAATADGTTSHDEPVSSTSTAPSRTNHVAWWTFALTLAASALLAFFVWPHDANVTSIATLLTSENASWESSLPTTVGSSLPPGKLSLLSGIATIRFDSGADVMLEAPSQLQLLTPMRGRLLTGAAVVDVPEPAIGFTLDTPDGFVVDHGTKFAVNVQADLERSEIEVIEGEISVHHTGSNEEMRLKDGQAVTMSQADLLSVVEPSAERVIEQKPKVIRVHAEQTTSIIRNDRRDKWLRDDLLMLKTSGKDGNFDRRALIAFDVSNVDFQSVDKVFLKLNLVPSGIGFANLLPEMNRFAVYGITNEEKNDWPVEASWNGSPSPEDGVLLGTFNVPRSRQTGVRGLGGEELFSFVKENADRRISLLIVRETTLIPGDGKSLVHAFASELHGEFAGPVLKFSTISSPSTTN
jgi:ferric-dicitrate binding protein FerR (iron transport regulator)